MKKLIMEEWKGVKFNGTCIEFGLNCSDLRILCTSSTISPKRYYTSDMNFFEACYPHTYTILSTIRISHHIKNATKYAQSANRLHTS